MTLHGPSSVRHPVGVCQTHMRMEPVAVATAAVSGSEQSGVHLGGRKHPSGEQDGWFNADILPSSVPQRPGQVWVAVLEVGGWRTNSRPPSLSSPCLAASQHLLEASGFPRSLRSGPRSLCTRQLLLEFGLQQTKIASALAGFSGQLGCFSKGQQLGMACPQGSLEGLLWP